MIVILGLCAMFIVLSSRNEIYSLESFNDSDVTDNQAETKLEIQTEHIETDKVDNTTKPVSSLQKMDQSDFDRIMNEIIMNKSKVSINSSHVTNDALPDIDSKWMTWDEYKNASQEERDEMLSEFEGPESIESSIAELIKQYDDNFDLESVIEQNPELQYLWEISLKNAEEANQRITDIENQILEIQTRRTFILKTAEEYGVELIYDDSGNPIDYEKDEQGIPILIDYMPSPEIEDIGSGYEYNSEIPLKSDIDFEVIQLWVKSAEEYPDIIISQQMSQDEYDSFFSTQESRQSLQERKIQMQNDIVKQIRNILPKSPNNRDQVISQLRKSLSENWDDDFADLIINQLKYID